MGAPSRRETLMMRVVDLNSRLEYLNELSEEDYNFISCGMTEYMYSEEDLLFMDVTEFYTASAIFKAVELAEEELNALEVQEEGSESHETSVESGTVKA